MQIVKDSNKLDTYYLVTPAYSGPDLDIYFKRNMANLNEVRSNSRIYLFYT